MIYDFAGNIKNDDGTNRNVPLAGSLPDLSNETVNPSIISGGTSKNFVSGNSGWTIRKDGSFELGSGSFRGIIEIGSTNTFSINSVIGAIELKDNLGNIVIYLGL